MNPDVYTSTAVVREVVERWKANSSPAYSLSLSEGYQVCSFCFWFVHWTVSERMDWFVENR